MRARAGLGKMKIAGYDGLPRHWTAEKVNQGEGTILRSVAVSFPEPLTKLPSNKATSSLPISDWLALFWWLSMRRVTFHGPVRTTVA